MVVGRVTSVRLVLSFQAMASSLTGAASFYAATAQQAIAAAVPPSPRPLKVVSWNTGPARNRMHAILAKLRKAGVAGEFDVILLQELPGQWANPMTPEEVKRLLHGVFPSDHGCILVLRHLVTVDMIDNPTQVEVRLFSDGGGKPSSRNVLAVRSDSGRASQPASRERRRRDGPEGLRAGARGEHGGVLVLPLQAAALRGLLGLGGHP